MSTRGEAMRQEVLTVLQESHGPLTAYDILRNLSAAHPKIAPTTVYRALSTLAERGCVHRIESLNAYMACDSVSPDFGAILSICNDCGTVEERIAPDLVTQLSSVISKSGFAPTRHAIEVHGLCGSCGGEPASE